MADFSFGTRPWSTKTPPQMGDGTQDFAVIEDEITDNLSVTVTSSDFDTGVYPWFNPLDAAYGAGGGGLTDDASAIQSAISAAEAAGRGEVLIPAGNYRLESRLVVDEGNMTISGQGPGVTTLTAKTGESIASMLHIGKTDGSSSTVTNITIQNLTLDGMDDGLVGVFLYNAAKVTLFNVEIKDTASHGIDGASSTALEGSLMEMNSLINVRVSGTGGDGVKWNAMRESSIVDLNVQNITGNGLHYYPYIEGSSPSLHAVSVYHVATNVQIFNTGGDGIIVDTIQRSSFSNTTVDTTAGVGFRLSTSGPDDAVALGSNSVFLSNTMLRKCDGGYLIMDEGASVDRLKSTNLTILGEGSSGPDDVFGIHLRGASLCQFYSTEVFLVSSSGIKLEDGTPAGVAGECNDITFDGLIVRQCGTAGSAEAHGINIADATTTVRISNAHLANAQTTGSNYEVNISGSAMELMLHQIHGSPNASGNFWNIGSGAEDEIEWSGVRVGANGTFEETVAVPGVNSDITIPPCDTVLLTGNGVSVDTITPLRNGARVYVVNNDAGSITLNHADGAAGQMLMLGGANVTLATNRGCMLVSRGSYWSCEV